MSYDPLAFDDLTRVFSSTVDDCPPQPEGENAKRNKLPAEQMLDLGAMKELFSKEW